MNLMEVKVKTCRSHDLKGPRCHHPRRLRRLLVESVHHIDHLPSGRGHHLLHHVHDWPGSAVPTDQLAVECEGQL